jgi:hypothetical protein
MKKYNTPGNHNTPGNRSALQLMTSNLNQGMLPSQNQEWYNEAQVIQLLRLYTAKEADTVFASSNYIKSKIQTLVEIIEECAIIDPEREKAYSSWIQLTQDNKLALHEKITQIHEIIIREAVCFKDLAAFTVNAQPHQMTQKEMQRIEVLFEKVKPWGENVTTIEGKQKCIIDYKNTSPFFRLYSLTRADENLGAQISNFIERSEKHFMTIVQNVTFAHWTSGVVKKSEHRICAYYLDPVGNQAPTDNMVFKEITRTLKAFPSELITVFDKDNRIQTDGHSCGPLTVELASKMVNSQKNFDRDSFVASMQKFKSQGECQKLRAQHKQAYAIATNQFALEAIVQSDNRDRRGEMGDDRGMGHQDFDYIAGSSEQRKSSAQKLLGKRNHQEHKVHDMKRKATQGVKIDDESDSEEFYPYQKPMIRTREKLPSLKESGGFSDKEIEKCAHIIAGRGCHAKEGILNFFLHRKEGQFLLKFLSKELKVGLTWLSATFYNNGSHAVERMKLLSEYFRDLAKQIINEEGRNISNISDIKLKLKILGADFYMFSNLLNNSGSKSWQLLINVFEYFRSLNYAQIQEIKTNLDGLGINAKNIAATIHGAKGEGFNCFIAMLERIKNNQKFLIAINQESDVSKKSTTFLILKALKRSCKKVIKNFDSIIEVLKSDDWNALKQSYAGNPYKLLTYLNCKNIQFFSKALLLLNKECAKNLTRDHKSIEKKFTIIIESLKADDDEAGEPAEHDPGDQDLPEEPQDDNDGGMMMQQQRAVDDEELHVEEERFHYIAQDSDPDSDYIRLSGEDVSYE